MTLGFGILLFNPMKALNISKNILIIFQIITFSVSSIKVKRFNIPVHVGGCGEMWRAPQWPLAFTFPLHSLDWLGMGSIWAHGPEFREERAFPNFLNSFLPPNTP
jgi:hypothetical protein